MNSNAHINLSGLVPENVRRAGKRALVLWFLVAGLLGVRPVLLGVEEYKRPMSETYRVSIFVSGADPEGASYWRNDNRAEDLPVSWTRAIYVPCFREATGNTFIKPFSFQEPSSPGGYIVTDSSIRTAREWREKNTIEVRDRRKECISRIDGERLGGAISHSISRYFVDYLRWYLAITVAVVAGFAGVRWVMSGLRE
jgi:hypothetical protein